MRKAYPGHAKRVMMAVWSYLRQFMYTKWVVVVDDDIDARNWKDVMWGDCNADGSARDITLVENTPIDISISLRLIQGWVPRSAWTRRTNFLPRRSANGGGLIRMDDENRPHRHEKWPRLGLPGTGKPIWR